MLSKFLRKVEINLFQYDVILTGVLSREEYFQSRVVSTNNNGIRKSFLQICPFFFIFIFYPPLSVTSIILHFYLASSCPTASDLTTVNVLYFLDKKVVPKSANDIKLINAGKFLENNKTVGQCRVPFGELPRGVITMHVVVQPTIAKAKTGNRPT